MESAITNIILSVVGNALTSLIAYTIDQSRKSIFGKDLFAKTDSMKSSLEPVINQIIDSVTDITNSIGTLSIEEVCLFLNTPEVETIIRQLFSAQITENIHNNQIELIKQEFITQFLLYFKLNDTDIRPIQNLYNQLVIVCDNTLSNAISLGNLSAHEIKSIF